MLFTLEVPLYGTIFRLKLIPAIQFSNLKPKLKIWEILIVDVLLAGKLVLQYLVYC